MLDSHRLFCEPNSSVSRVKLDAMSKVLSRAAAMATVVLVVDAKHERAAAYYEGHRFIRFPSAPLRLVMHLDTIAQALAAP